MLLVFILVTFCKMFCCLRLHILHITPSDWLIDQLAFFIGAIHWRKIRSRHWQLLFYQNNHRIFYLFVLKTSLVWETVSVEYCYWFRRFISWIHKEVRCFFLFLFLFFFICCSLISKNVFVCLFSGHKTYIMAYFD